MLIHPCRLDFERFGEHIGLKKKRIEMILDSFSVLPDEVEHLVNNSFLTDKMKRTYLRIVKERIQRFDRKSEWKIFWLGDVSIHGQSPLNQEKV